MEALKWFCYVVAAIAVLSVVTGVGLLIIAIVTIGGAIVFSVGLVTYVAMALRGSVESKKRRQ